MLITSDAKLDKAVESFSFSSFYHLKQLSRIYFPLMLAAFSSTFMIFLDRVFLAKYDTQTMVAATAAANAFFVFQFGAMAIASITEVFVGQFNGAQQWERVGRPVWQMIWFSLLCALIMLPIGLWGHAWFIPPQLIEEGQPYFKWIMIFGPSFPLVGALSAFFVGTGRVKIVVISIILGNVLNFGLLLVLVFGIPGWINPMGAKGAAIATGLAHLGIALGLLFIFLNEFHRARYHSYRWQFDKILFLQCIKIGTPNAIGHMIAACAWVYMVNLLAGKSLAHVTVIAIGQSIWMLFSFITEGLQKGITAIAANYIGAKKREAIRTVLTTGLRLQLLLALILAIPLVIFPDCMVAFFIPRHHLDKIAHLRELVEMSCRWLWVAYLFDGMAWVIDGILTAAGDVKFIMLMNSIGTWLFCVLPIYWIVIRGESGPLMTLKLIAGFCFILFVSYFLRYKTERWQKIKVT